MADTENDYLPSGEAKEDNNDHEREQAVEESHKIQTRNVVSVGLKAGYERDAKGYPVQQWG